MRRVLWGLAITAALACRADGSGAGASWATAKVSEAEEGWSPEVDGVRVYLRRVVRGRGLGVRCYTTVTWDATRGAPEGTAPEVHFYDAAGRVLPGREVEAWGLRYTDGSRVRVSSQITFAGVPPSAVFARAELGPLLTPRVRVLGPGGQ